MHERGAASLGLVSVREQSETVLPLANFEQMNMIRLGKTIWRFVDHTSFMYLPPRFIFSTDKHFKEIIITSFKGGMGRDASSTHSFEFYCQGFYYSYPTIVLNFIVKGLIIVTLL